MNIIKEIREYIEEFKPENLDKVRECECGVCYNMNTVQAFLLKMNYIKDCLEELEEKLKKPKETSKIMEFEDEIEGEMKYLEDEIEDLDERLSAAKYRVKAKKECEKISRTMDIISKINKERFDEDMKKYKEEHPSPIIPEYDPTDIDSIMKAFGPKETKKELKEEPREYEFVDPKKYDVDRQIKGVKEINKMAKRVLSGEDVDIKEIEELQRKYV